MLHSPRIEKVTKQNFTVRNYIHLSFYLVTCEKCWWIMIPPISWCYYRKCMKTINSLFPQSHFIPTWIEPLKTFLSVEPINQNQLMSDASGKRQVVTCLSKQERWWIVFILKILCCCPLLFSFEVTLESKAIMRDHPFLPAASPCFDPFPLLPTPSSTPEAGSSPTSLN